MDDHESAPPWMQWVRALQAISQTGLHYAQNPYDTQRYRELGALAAQIQVLVDDNCRQHRSLSAPAAVVTQVTTRLARPATIDGALTDAIVRDEYPAQPVVARGVTPTDVPVAEEVPSLTELLATVQKGQPLVAAGPISDGTHP